MWGRPASPRPAGMGMPPRVHRLSDNGSDPLLELVGSWFCLTVAVVRPAGLGEAGRPPSSPSRPMVLLMLHCAFVHPPGKWVARLLWSLGCLVSLWTKVDAFRCIQLNQSTTLDSGPHECVSWPLDRSRGRDLEGARPAWDFAQFCSILVYLLLKSKLIQNLWNSLEINKL